MLLSDIQAEVEKFDYLTVDWIEWGDEINGFFVCVADFRMPGKIWPIFVSGWSMPAGDDAAQTRYVASDIKEQADVYLKAYAKATEENMEVLASEPSRA